MIQLAYGDHLAEVALFGAELRRWAWRGRELMWTGDPAWWTGISPLLFPVVGALNGDRFTYGGRAFELPKHGFARRLPWVVVDQDPAQVRFRLTDTEATRAAYPFAFSLDAHYALADEGLRLTLTLANPGDAPLPASLGLHPAFRWPLEPERPKEDYRVVFAADEPDPLRQLEAGLLGPKIPSPVVGRTLALCDDLFAHDALIWTAPRSRALTYGAPGGLGLRLTHTFPHLGLWTKPGAPYLCLEPWHGHADPVGFAGDLREKPGQVILAPGETRAWTCLIQVLPPSDTLDL